MQSTDLEKRDVELTPIQEAAALDKLSDEDEYPSGIKLFVITIALCLSVFLVALVGVQRANQYSSFCFTDMLINGYLLNFIR